MKKTLIIITSLLSISALGSCGLFGNNGGEDIDETKTQIGISNWGGGYGTKWLESLTENYAKLVEDVSFEEGKKGVQFTLNQEKEHRDSVAKINGLTTIDIVFDEGVVYNMYSTSGCFRDISDILNGTNPYDGKKIIDKFSDTQKSGLNKGGKYYAAPGYAGSYGITYNKELMNSKNLYFKQGGGFTNDAGTKTAGPDGVSGTYDDGLPTSIDEFFTLCDRAKSTNLVPIIAAGGCADYYVPAMLSNLSAANDGYDVASGRIVSKANNVSCIKLDDVTSTEQVNITTANGYEFLRTEGLYKAFNVFERLISGSYMVDKSLGTPSIFSADTNLAAQSYFVEGCENGKQALMLVEGDWWFNEAVDNGFANQNEANYGWMPLPNNSENTTTNYFDGLLDLCYVRSGSDPAKAEAIKDFLYYAYSDQSLNNFTKVTNTRWGLNYELTSEVRDSLHAYGKSLNDFYESDKTNIITTVSQDPFFIENESALQVYHSSYLQLNSSQNIIRHIKNGGTAKSYISDLYNVWKDKGIWH